MISISRGTMILAIASDHGLYLASDSRMVNPSVGTSSNAAQKIFQCGPRAFVAISGALIHGGFTRQQHARTEIKLDLMRMLRSISSCYVGDNSNLVEYIATHLSAAYEKFKEEFLDVPLFAKAADPSTISGIATIAGQPCVFEIEIGFSPSGQIIGPTIKYLDHIITGWGKIDGVADGLERDLTNPTGVSKFISAMFERSAVLYPEAVGGPTDIGFLDGNRASWIVHKDLDKLSVND
jgi:hypothetical protein